jgi:hypothetical protein
MHPVQFTHGLECLLRPAELPVEVAAADGCSWWQRTFDAIAVIDGYEPEANVTNLGSLSEVKLCSGTGRVSDG